VLALDLTSSQRVSADGVASVAARDQHEYTTTVDDIGCSMRVSYTPVRADGLAGTTTTAQTEGIVAPADPYCASVTLEGEVQQVCMRGGFGGQ
jgi:hypothetical protein